MKNITSITFTARGTFSGAPNIHGGFYQGGQLVYTLPDVGELLYPDVPNTVYTFAPPIPEADRLDLWFALINPDSWTALEVEIAGDTIKTVSIPASREVGRTVSLRLAGVSPWLWVGAGAGILGLIALIARRR